MRKMGLCVLVATLWIAPRPASAGWLAEGSFGIPFATNQGWSSGQLNFMLTPGYGILDDILRAELGLVANFASVQGSSFNVGLRPMIALHPPILPLYGKLIFDWNDIGNGSTTALGGAIGTSFGLGFLSLFLEGGYLPRSVNVFELRAGLALAL